MRLICYTICYTKFMFYTYAYVYLHSQSVNIAKTDDVLKLMNVLNVSYTNINFVGNENFNILHIFMLIVILDQYVISTV